MFRKSLIASIAMGLMFSSMVMAQEKRDIDYKADKSLNVSKKELIAKAKKKREKAKSSIKYEDFIQRAKKVQNLKLPILKSIILKSKRQIQLLRKTDKRRVEYLFRMADAFVQLEQIYKFKYGEATEKLTTAKGTKRRLWVRRKALYLKRKKQYLVTALKLLNRISTNEAYSDWHRMDEVLFKLGDIARELGYQDIMKQKFQDLLSQHPKSKFVPNVYLAFAEFYFKQGRKGLSKATAFYKKVVASRAKGTGIYYYARRMLGWCYFNLQRFPLALSNFLFVAKKAKRDSLRAQARNEVVMTYSYQGNRKQAYDFFKHQLGAKYVRDLYIKLAQEYFAQGNMINMIWVYQDMIRRFPRDVNRCDWHRQVYLGYKLDQRVEEMTEALNNLVDTMGDMKKQFGEKKMQYKVCRDFAKSALFDQAKRWFAKVEKGKAKTEDEQKKLMISAAKLYQRFLEYFPKSEDVWEMRGDYAYLLYKLAEMYEQETNGRNQDAVRARYKAGCQEYTKLLKWDKKPSKLTQVQFKKQRRQVGNDTVACWMKVLAVDFKKEESGRSQKAEDYKKRRNCLKAKKKMEDMGRKFRRRCPEFKKNLPISENLKKVIEVFELYVKYVDGGKYLSTIKYNRAMIFYMYRHFKEAIPLFKDAIFTTYENNPEMAYRAVNFLMIAYDAEDRFGEMVDTISELLKPKYNKMFTVNAEARKLRKELVKAKLENLELQVSRLGSEGRFQDAGDLLMKMASEYKESSTTEKVIKYYNSAYIAYEKAGQVGQAIRSLKVMQHFFGSEKKNKMIIDSNLKIGRLFEKIAMFGNAAKSYEDFFKQYPRDPDAVKAARRSVKLYWWSGDVRKAEKKAREFVTKLNRMGARKFRGDMASLFFMLHKFYLGKNQSRVTKYLQFFIKNMAKTRTNDLIIRAYSKLGKIYWDSSCPVETKYGVCMKIVYVTKRSKTDTWKEAKTKFVPRKRKVLRLAKSYFKKAVKYYNAWRRRKKTLGSTGKFDSTQRVKEALNAAAMAKFHLAEIEYEDIISAEIPMISAKKLQKSMSQVQKWMKKQTKLMLKAKKLYEQVGNIKLGKRGRSKYNDWYVPAAGRFGAIFRNFHTKVNNIKFGKAFDKNITAKLKMRDVFAEATEKFEKFAKNGFIACVKAAQRTGRYDEWQEFCEKELAEIRNSVSPLADEVWSEPKYTNLKPGKATIMTVPVR
jgi:hypothetical protein